MGGPALAEIAQGGGLMGMGIEKQEHEIKTTIADLEGGTIVEKAALGKSTINGGFTERKKTAREAEVDKILLERLMENEADYETAYKEHYANVQYPSMPLTAAYWKVGDKQGKKAKSYKEMPIDWLQEKVKLGGSKKNAAQAGGTVLTQDNRLAEAFDLAGGNS